MPHHYSDSKPDPWAGVDPDTIVCAVCGERSASTPSFVGYAHRWGPMGHNFEAKRIVMLSVFYVDENGYGADGLPYVLPHVPGERAFGVVGPGWFWIEDGEPVGPFYTEIEAAEDARARD